MSRPKTPKPVAYSPPNSWTLSSNKPKKPVSTRNSPRSPLQQVSTPEWHSSTKKPADQHGAKPKPNSPSKTVQKSKSRNGSPTSSLHCTISLPTSRSTSRATSPFGFRNYECPSLLALKQMNSKEENFTILQMTQLAHKHLNHKTEANDLPNHHRHGLLHDNLIHNFQQLHSDSPHKRSTPSSPSSPLAPVHAHLQTVHANSHSPLNPIVSISSTSTILIHSMNGSQPTTPTSPMSPNPFHDPMYSKHQATKQHGDGRNTNQNSPMPKQLAPLHHTSDQSRNYERMLNPKRKGAKWMPRIDEKDMDYFQSFTFGEQNNSYSCYNEEDFRSDLEFYEQFICTSTPSFAIPQIVVGANESCTL